MPYPLGHVSSSNSQRIFRTDKPKEKKHNWDSIYRMSHQPDECSTMPFLRVREQGRTPDTSGCNKTLSIKGGLEPERTAPWDSRMLVKAHLERLPLEPGNTQNLVHQRSVRAWGTAPWDSRMLVKAHLERLPLEPGHTQNLVHQRSVRAWGDGPLRFNQPDECGTRPFFWWVRAQGRIPDTSGCSKTLSIKGVLEPGRMAPWDSRMLVKAHLERLQLEPGHTRPECAPAQGLPESCDT